MRKKTKNQLVKIAKISYIAGSASTEKASMEKCEVCAETMHRMYTRCNDVLKELHDVYRAENPSKDGRFYVPDRHTFYTWIVKKIKEK